MRRLALTLWFAVASAPAIAQSPAYSGHGAEQRGGRGRRPVRAGAARRGDVAADPGDARRAHAGARHRRRRTGKRLYFGWSITGTPQVFRLDAPQCVPGPDDGRRGPDVGGRGSRRTAGGVVLQRDAGGSEEPGLYLQPAGWRGAVDRAQRCRACARRSCSRATTARRSTSPRTTSRRTASRSIATTSRPGRSTTVFADKGVWSVADRRGRGDAMRLLLVKVKGSFAREYFEYVPATGVLTPLLGAGEAVEYAAAYAAQPGELLVRTNRFDDFRRLYRWRIGADTTRDELSRDPGARRHGRRRLRHRRCAPAHLRARQRRRVLAAASSSTPRTFAPLASAAARRTPGTSSPAPRRRTGGS